MALMGWRFAARFGLLLVVGSQAHAQFTIGRYSDVFLAHGAGARALAMGSAATADPSPATAGYYNPSALAGTERQSLEFMHASEFENLYTYDFLSYARPLRGNSVGSVSVLYQRVNDIPLTRLDDPARPLGDDNRVLVDTETGDHEIAILGACGKEWKHGWKMGAAGKLLVKSLAGESAYGLGFDLGLSRAVSPNVKLGIAAHDITTSVLAWSTGRTESIVPSLVLGGNYRFDFHAANAAVTVAADLENRFESRGQAAVVDAGPLSVDPHVGLEYLISNTVALRGGVNADKLTYGAGLKFSSLQVDAAFQNHDELGLTHRISAAVSW
jgi:hypothetical protein